jgi:hypothetical protein
MLHGDSDCGDALRGVLHRTARGILIFVVLDAPLARFIE